MRLAHEELLNDPDSVYGSSSFSPSEICAGDERIVEQQIMLFMKTCVLPLAMQTKALILVSGSNDCYVTSALARVALAEQARLGKNCPFTVLATACEMEIHARAVSPKPKDRNTIAQQICRASPTWVKKAFLMNEFYSKKFLRERKKLSLCDLTEAAERYIIFESYDPPADESGVGEYNKGPRKQFESTLLQYMTRKLPCIAISCLQASHGVPFIVDLANRNIPVLILDTTERAFTLDVDENKEIHTRLARESRAFPMIPEEQAAKIKVSDGGLSMEVRLTLLNIAFEMIERKMAVMATHKVNDSLLMSLIAFFHTVLHVGNDVADGDTGRSTKLYERILELEKIEKNNRVAKSSSVPHELVDRVMNFIYSRIGALNKICEREKLEDWINTQTGLVDKSLVVLEHRHFISPAIGKFKKLKAQCKAIEENDGFLEEYELNGDDWLATHDMFLSPNVFSASVFDAEEAKRILGSVAKIDRLPSANTLEALRVIQDGWDHVEIYHEMADTYKVVTKICYVLLLVSAMTITFLALVQSNLGYPSRVPVIVIAFGVSGLTSYVA